MGFDKKDFVKATSHAVVTPGESLKMIRELQGYTQEQLAELSGIKQSNISALERNSAQFGRERCLKLAKALRVHPAVLLFPDFEILQVA